MSSKRTLYLMIVNGERQWLSLQHVDKVYSAGWFPVSIGGRVMDEDEKERDITDEERSQISEIADRYSESR